MTDKTERVPPEREIEVKNKIEQIKCLFDYLKHFATVSTAIILLIPNLINKGGISVQGVLMGKASIILFSLTIIASLVIYTLLISNFPSGNKSDFKRKGLLSFFILMVWSSFVLGIISVAGFSIYRIK